MVREHRLFIVLKIKDKWTVFFGREKVSPGYILREDAESYKKFLLSR